LAIIASALVIKQALEAAEIEMPFPTQSVIVSREGGE
jgi:hypothetical protein